MKHRVRWKHSALDELADIWMAAEGADRADITTAVHTIEEELAVLGNSAGESRSGSERIIFRAPVAMLFEIADNQSDIRVLQIWRY